MTVGMWSWKSKPSKECVTTHRPNGLALKMDGARAEGLYPAVAAVAGWSGRSRPQRVGGPSR